MRRLRAAWVAGLLMATPAVAGVADELGPTADERFSRGSAEAVSSEPWWRDFGDERLTAAVEAAMTGNRDLAGLRAVEGQLRAAGMQARSALSPTVSANGFGTVAPMDSLGFGFGLPTDPTAPKTYVQGQGTLDAQWQLDVFGRSAATWRAQQRDAEAAEGDVENLASATASLVAGAYFDVVAAQERVSVVEAQIRTNRELLEILELRYERGDSQSLDVLQQRQQLASTEALLPTLELVRDTSNQRLAVLLGQLPNRPVEVASTLPEPSASVNVGTPAELVQNRPSLRSAADRLRSARDRRWAATASLLPTLGLSATAGWQFIDRGEFTDQTYWNAGASISVPIFGGGRNLGTIRQSRAAYDGQAAQFEGAVLTAVQEVEGALSREQYQRQAVDAQAAQLQAARAASEAAKDQYLRGVAPFLNVQNALAREQAAELTLIQGRRDLLSARIALHVALGGPWTQNLGTDGEPRP